MAGEGMQIKDLPFGVVFKLCRQLDSPHADRFSWRALLSHVPHSPYTALDVGSFQRMGEKPNGSPTEAVLQDFIARAFSVDDLYSIMRDMGYVEGMKLLQEYVSPKHQHLLSELMKENQTTPPGPAPLEKPLPPVSSKGGESLVVDPLHGPLPPANPPGNHGYQVEVVQPGVKGQAGEKEKEKEGKGVQFPWQQPHPLPPQSQPQNGTAMGQPEVSVPFQYQITNGGYINLRNYPQTTPPGPTHPNYPHTTHPGPTHPNYLPTTHPGPAHPNYHLPSYQHQFPQPPVGGVSEPSSAPSSTPQYSYTPSPHNLHLTPSSPANSTTTSSSAASETYLPNILHFSFQELSEATGGFTAGLLGMGSFGSVYKAMVRGTGPYAVKKLHNECECEGGIFYEMIHRDTFLQELQMLTKYPHRNILLLVAYSNDGYRPCLVYDYMENGSLGDCLHGQRNVRLLWDVRLSIADQVAAALHFIHTINHPRCLVHGDVKSANILLDSHLVPKLSDFGLARECSAHSSEQSQFSTQSEVVMGTVAYMAPEFFRNRKLSSKTDVYSFGVVLLELYTGLAADDPTIPQRALTMRLAHLFEETAQQSEVAAQADPHAGWPGNVGCGLFDIATVCVRRKARQRPTMDQVKMQVSSLAVEMNLDQLHISSPPQAPPPYSYP